MSLRLVPSDEHACSIPQSAAVLNIMPSTGLQVSLQGQGQSHYHVTLLCVCTAQSLSDSAISLDPVDQAMSFCVEDPRQGSWKY